MSYSNNPLLPKARAEALKLVALQGMPMSIAARRSGIHRTTLWRWKHKWLKVNENVQLENFNRPARDPGSNSFRLAALKWLVPTLSSRPHSSPHALAQAVIDRIVYWRNQHERCAGVVHAHCLREGIKVSLSSVKRVLKRLGLLRPVSKWKKCRPHVIRPLALSPGDLVQTDTIHIVDRFSTRRVYLFTLIDVYSRWTYVEYHERLSQRVSYEFLKRGEGHAGFKFRCVQSDNGPEFGRWLNDQLRSKGIVLRHSRVHKPNDNAFIERFNRTVQQEGLDYTLPDPRTIQEQLKAYLAYYNKERLHSSLQYRTPQEMLQRS